MRIMRASHNLHRTSCESSYSHHAGEPSRAEAQSDNHHSHHAQRASRDTLRVPLLPLVLSGKFTLKYIIPYPSIKIRLGINQNRRGAKTCVKSLFVNKKNKGPLGTRLRGLTQFFQVRHIIYKLNFCRGQNLFKIY